MQRNFTTREDIYLSCDGNDFDIHSAFKFSRFAYDAEQQTVTLIWNERLSDRLLEIIFCQLTFLRVKEADAAYPRREAKTTSFIGFLSVEDVDVMDGFLPDSGINLAHFIVGFQDESAIKVGAKEAYLSVS